MLYRFFRMPVLSEVNEKRLRAEATSRLGLVINGIWSEWCFYVQVREALTAAELETLQWLLCETFAPTEFSSCSFLSHAKEVLEVGPRLNFATAWSSNAAAVCAACGLDKIQRIERSRRYWPASDAPLTTGQQSLFLNLVHDRMTECPYPEPLLSFATGMAPEPVLLVPLQQEGKVALEKINKKTGLGFDQWDIDYYQNLFIGVLGRNPTNVELFDVAQSNSEHSRHWFFKGRLIINGQEMPYSLLELVQMPLKVNPGNSVIAFRDNSSGIKGYQVETIVPLCPGQSSAFVKRQLDYHIIFTAETHNFPSGVAPFPGAETGTGGRIRDVHATGQGALVVAGTAAYCVGNLLIPGYDLPWEDSLAPYPTNLASALQIEIEASNGASDYGNKFGEPVIQGFTRSFGLRLPNGERREWIKPIMFTGGIGQIDARHITKAKPEPGMLIFKIGGPAYRIGMGGGAASSMVQGENIAELDFNAVQRGDAEMEQKVNRVIRACVEMGENNPIVSIHDQGAGGAGNVIKEIVAPAGAKINIRAVKLGDETLSVLEIWGAEYQEQNALLLRSEHKEMFVALCEREKVRVDFVGEITGDGNIIVYDEQDGSTPVNLPLDRILGSMPRKTFHSERITPALEPLRLPPDITVKSALERVLRLSSVGSKRFLTTKVDRSVTGLIAQQQCVGPLQLTLADVAVVAQGHFGITGAALAIGEQPIKGFVSPAAMARLAVGEVLTNLVWAKISAFEDIKCSANWMWAAKLPGEAAQIYEAADALSHILLWLGIAVDGGKDSLSMAAHVSGRDGSQELVKAPGELVVSAYATCPDITKTVTPDLKLPGNGRLIYADLGAGKYRLGGSALAQCFEQIGDEVPDVEDPLLLKQAFLTIQKLIAEGLISAGHDRSDGGLVATLLEMAFAGNCGFEVNVPIDGDPFRIFFAEELGLVLEAGELDEGIVLSRLRSAGIPALSIGRTIERPLIWLEQCGQVQLSADTRGLRDLWEETSFQLDRRQANPLCVEQEKIGLWHRKSPMFNLSFVPKPTAPAIPADSDKPRVAIIREEGGNGDREMASAFFSAGFEPWDITMTDLLAGHADLKQFQGMAFVGGFSYADVLDAAKGWAGVIRFNPLLAEQFDDFYRRPDTFSFGVCNGCQLMALLGWIPWRGLPDTKQPRFIKNQSERFESRFVAVEVQLSPAIMLQEMAGSRLGIWVAHGEGRIFFPDERVLELVKYMELTPIRYMGDNGCVTTTYPFNPNGSTEGIAALCSPDGRHLAMMPHPERTFLNWQWPWMPADWRRTLTASPWLKMFQNAREWCLKRR